MPPEDDKPVTPPVKPYATFDTPEALNERLNSARSKASREAVEALLKELGVEKTEDLKSSITRLREVDAKSKTELERMQAQEKDWEKKKSEYEAEQAKLSQENALLKFNSKFSDAASNSKLLPKNLRSLRAEYKELLVEAGDAALTMDEFLAKAKEDRPELFDIVKEPMNPEAPPGTGNPKPKDDKKPKPPEAPKDPKGKLYGVSANEFAAVRGDLSRIKDYV